VTEPVRFQVLGIDPGGTTGLASYNQKLWDVRQLPANEVAAYVRQWIDWPVPADLHVVCERFVPSARTLSFQPDALELIGYTRYLCQEKGIDFSLQSPAPAKKLFPNTLLKTIGAYRQSTPHGLDAARHVALWMHSNQPGILRGLKQGKSDD